MFKETPNGIVIPIKVVPKAHRSEIVGWENDLLKVRLAAVPEKGEANDELIRLLSKELGVSKSQITLTHGHTSRQKRVCIAGISLDTLKQKLTN